MIYDCITFFNELDMLELRLNILNDYVDKFVIAEGNKTHTGSDKEFVLERNFDRFEAFKDKIIYVKVEDFPPLKKEEEDSNGNNWLYENFQRDAIIRGLKDCKPDDLVFISDCDEIWNPTVLKKYSSGICSLKQYNCYYNYNTIDYGEIYIKKAKMCRYSDLVDPKQDIKGIEYCSHSKYGLPTYLRFCKGKKIYNAGWHFTYINDIDSIILKRNSIVEQQFNTEENMSAESIKKMIENGEDILERGSKYLNIYPKDFLPNYIINNREKYKTHITQKHNLPLYMCFLIKGLSNIISVQEKNGVKFLKIFGVRIKIGVNEEKFKNKMSIVIPTLQKEVKILDKLIDELDMDDTIFEIIIIDNSIKGYKHSSKKVRVIIPNENLYVNPSWNLGVKEAKCKYIGILNDDLLLPKNLCKQVQIFLANHSVGLIGLGNSVIKNSLIDKFDTYPKNRKMRFKKMMSPKDMNGSWGSAIFGEKEHFYPIPEDLKIFCGDNYYLFKNNEFGHRNYKIQGAKIKHLTSLSSGERGFNPIKENDIAVYKTIDQNYERDCIIRNEPKFLQRVFSIRNEQGYKYLYLLFFRIKITKV